MVKEISPAGPLNARIRIPGSKSITNRALVCAALADGESFLRNASDSDDSALMANGLNQLGVLVRPGAQGWTVHGTGGVLYAPRYPIPVGNAGTTLRFLLGVGAIAKGTVVFEGADRIAARPIHDLLDALGGLGVETVFSEGTPRFQVKGGLMHGGEVRVRGDKSSQFLSSLLMVAPYAGGDVRIRVDGPLASASYVQITLEVMKRFGVEVHQPTEGRVYSLTAGSRYRPTEFIVEADASGASYAFAMAAIAGGGVIAEGARTDSLQGDVGFLNILREMGCEVAAGTDGVLVKRERTLRGVDCDMNTMPDVVPSLAAVALFAEGITHVRNVAHLRYKESDRLEALATELRKLGALVTVHPDGLEIVPVPLHGALLDPHDDHRLAMSFALIGLRVPGVRIENPGCVKKSFPGFWSEFEKLY
jgi:3-phosphoshikimate 1-carboxyvinyltransferase